MSNKIELTILFFLVQNDIVNTESMLFEIQILISKILLRVDQTKKYIQNHKNGNGKWFDLIKT